MAKGGNSQKSNGSRSTKPYDVSNSFVTKVASRVSDYLGGWFGSPFKFTNNAKSTEASSTRETPGIRTYESYDVKRPSFLPHSYLHVDEVETTSSPAKRFKPSQAERVDIDFPISPIPSTSGMLASSTVNHTREILKSEDFMTAEPGPSSLSRQRYSVRETITAAPPTSSTATDMKANGTTDNHSDSSESTSGCSSLVPQSDRLSQSAYVCSSRKRNLEDKLKYARQLQQSRTSMFLNRSIPVGDVSGGRKRPSFDVTAYGTASLDKSLLREKLVSSPFYTGQTSYGGASAYRLSRNSFYSQRSPRSCLDRREGMNVEVKPSHDGSTDSVANMSHTAKKILEALEQFSTPVNDAKRIPVNRLTPLGSKRRRGDELSESRMRLSTPISPLNPNPGPVITGLNVPTVPDLLKLKRLERIQNSTAAARQVAVEKQEYTLPSDVAPAKRTGKIVTKLKDKEKNVSLEKLEEVNLPKIPLPITTLPKFDFKLPPMAQSVANKPETKEQITSRTFKFSDPIFVTNNAVSESPAGKNNFTFSNPLNANEKSKVPEKEVPSLLTNFMSSEAVAKLKRKSINDTNVKGSDMTVHPVVNELKTGSVMDFFKNSSTVKETVDTKSSPKVASGTWECGSCLIRNLNESKICCGCKTARPSNEPKRTLPSPVKKPSVEEIKPVQPVMGFGDKFKPPVGSWSCKECFISNKESALKCLACESPKPSAVPPKPASSAPALVPVAEVPKPAATAAAPSGFGDFFKKQANQWECSVCMIRNKESDTKCAACETPKPGSKPEKVESKFTFGTTPAAGGFVFGIDKAGVKTAADSSTFKIQTNGPPSESAASTGSSQFKPISTSVGVFTFGIPPVTAQEKKEESPKDIKATTETNTSRFMVTSTSGSGVQNKVDSASEPVTERTEENNENRTDIKSDRNEVSVTDSSKSKSEVSKPFIFGSACKSASTPFFGMSKEENKEKTSEPEAKAPAFVFGSASGSSSLETVSSSTTDFTFKQNKPAPSLLGGPDTGLPKSAATFQFKPFGSSEVTQKSSSALSGSSVSCDANEAEVKSSSVSTSVGATTSASIFGSASIFNNSNSNSKMSFGTTSTSSSGLGFMPGSSTTSNATPFTMPAQAFGVSGFGAPTLTKPATQPTQPEATSTPTLTPASPPAPAPAPTSAPAPTPTPAPASAATFGAPPAPAEKPVLGSAFGNSPTNFGTVPNPFAVVDSTDAPKPFGGLRSTSSVPSFGSSSTPSFGSSFTQPTAPASKPAQPFVFGSSQESTSTPAVSTPGVFTFGASKPSQFSFGQSSGSSGSSGSSVSSTFTFGSSTPSNNVFGNFGQPKTGGISIGQSPSPFGTSTSIFGQNSAPPAFTAEAPKFEFGAPSVQQQQQQPSVFKFGATSAQPATASPGAGFSLSIPQKFNFTGGQAPTTFRGKLPARVAAPLWGQAPMRQTDTPGHEMPGKDGDLSRNGAREKTDGRKERTGQNGWSQVGSVEVIEGRDGKQSESVVVITHAHKTPTPTPSEAGRNQTNFLFNLKPNL
ncbi:hypothetical protein RUM44_010134 [Polyplax serrata]|uniref:Nuclear pore complex protein Nup153 n=1 Tax=Polyplax serrata TaxID=468196 RepID=A0ABR1AUN5_POLSC